MLIDNNLIAYEYSKGQFTLNEIYPSGQKEEDNLIDKYSKGREYAVLTLQDDIIDPEGYGLKKGFYNVSADEGLDYIYLFQSGKLKARVPVLEIKRNSPQTTGIEKPKKMSERQYQRYKEKEYRKYIRGENPEEFEYKSADITYVEESKAWLIRYTYDNLELVGIIKF